MQNFALVIQEPYEDYISKQKLKGQVPTNISYLCFSYIHSLNKCEQGHQRKHIVILTDGRSESLKKRVEQSRDQKKFAGKVKVAEIEIPIEGSSKDPKKPFTHIMWQVKSTSPDEKNMVCLIPFPFIS